MTTPTLDRQVESRLGEHNVRYTRGRRAVIEALLSSDGPKSAAELDGSLSDLPLSSLYRTLGVLESAGVVAPHHGSRGVTRYEIADWLRGHHHHVVCIDCGAVEDIEIPERDERLLDEVIGAAAKSVAFEPVDHSLEIVGRCSNCS